MGLSCGLGRSGPIGPYKMHVGLKGFVIKCVITCSVYMHCVCLFNACVLGSCGLAGPTSVTSFCVPHKRLPRFACHVCAYLVLRAAQAFTSFCMPRKRDLVLRATCVLTSFCVLCVIGTWDSC